jgi:hypothetical protein
MTPLDFVRNRFETTDDSLLALIGWDQWLIAMEDYHKFMISEETEPETNFKFYTYEELSKEFTLIIGKEVLFNDINSAVNSLCKLPEFELYYFSERFDSNLDKFVKYIREPLNWYDGDSIDTIVDFPVGEKYTVLLNQVDLELQK